MRQFTQQSLIEYLEEKERNFKMFKNDFKQKKSTPK